MIFKRWGELVSANYSSIFFFFLIQQETNSPTWLPFKKVTYWCLKKKEKKKVKEVTLVASCGSQVLIYVVYTELSLGQKEGVREAAARAVIQRGGSGMSNWY